MALNDVDTTGKYCPINGFNPPCGLCMWALINDSHQYVSCAIPALTKDTCSYPKNMVRKIDE